MTCALAASFDAGFESAVQGAAPRSRHPLARASLRPGATAGLIAGVGTTPLHWLLAAVLAGHDGDHGWRRGLRGRDGLTGDA